GAQELALERDRAGDAADGQVALDGELAVALRLDAGAGEGEIRVALGVEEVGRAQVRVALGLARVDAGGGDLHLDARIGGVRLVDDDGPFHVGEAAFDRRDHQVLDGELDVRVHGVDLPRGRGRGGRRLFARQ